MVERNQEKPAAVPLFHMDRLRTQCTRVNAGLNPLFIHFNSLPVWWSTLIWALRSVPDLLIFDSLLICPPPPLTLFSPLSFIYAVFVWLAPQ